MSQAGPFALVSSQPNDEQLQSALGSTTLVTKVQISGGTPAALNQPTWFVDQQNNTGLASDKNDGLTANTPLLTDAQRQTRWGGVSPSLPSSLASCTITYLSGSPDATDPILISPRLFGTSLFVTQAQPPARSSGNVLSTVTAKNIPTNQALQATLPAGTVAGDVVINATRGNSFAVAFKNLGGNLWQLTQPLAAVAAGTIGTTAPTQNNAWANGDSITVLRGATNAPATPTQWNLNICEFAPVQYISGPGFTGVPMLRDVLLGSPVAGNAGFDTMILGGGARYLNCNIARKYFLNPTLSLVFPTAFQGCFLTNGGAGGNASQLTLFAAGGNNFTSNSWPIGIGLDCDYMMTGSTGASFVDSMAIFNLGTVFIDQGSVLPNGGGTGFTTMTTTYNGNQAAVYGPGTVNTWTMVRYNGTAVASFPCTGGVKIRNSALAYGATTTGGNTAWRQAALSAAQLDAAAPGGFAGYAVWPDYGGYIIVGAPP